MPPPSPKRTKIVIALQFWSGDKEKAMHLAHMIADIEPVFNKNVDFAFFARFDEKHDDATIGRTSRKFNVWKMTSRIEGTGWPDGCNAMAIDCMMQANERANAEWKTVKAVYLIESDVLPMRRDWLKSLSDEWDKASALGKYVMGSWCPFHSPVGHINGNMLFDPRLVEKLRGLPPVEKGRAWDTEFAPKFEPIWWKSTQMANHYEFKRNIQPEILFSSVDGKTPVAVVHGVKDLSGERQIRSVLFPEV